MSAYAILNTAPPEPPPPEVPQNPIPDSEDPARPSIPEELPQPNPDPSPNQSPPLEMGGRNGPEATRFGDWENNGKCVDF